MARSIEMRGGNRDHPAAGQDFAKEPAGLLLPDVSP
jgi:hypothetical protein